MGLVAIQILMQWLPRSSATRIVPCSTTVVDPGGVSRPVAGGGRERARQVPAGAQRECKRERREREETVQYKDSEMHGYPPRCTPNSRNRVSFVICRVLLCITGDWTGARREAETSKGNEIVPRQTCVAHSKSTGLSRPYLLFFGGATREATLRPPSSCPSRGRGKYLFKLQRSARDQSSHTRLFLILLKKICTRQEDEQRSFAVRSSSEK